MSDLIDRQALRAAHGLGSDCHDCKRDMKSCQYDRDYSLMDFCEWLDDAPTASPWHRCEDELPPAHENLLCCGSRGGMFVGWVLGSAVCIFGSCTGFVHGGKGRQFTHWMPLPEPPKEDADGK